MPAKPRRERPVPKVFAKGWINNLLAYKGDECFVPNHQYRDLERKYFKLFERYKKLRQEVVSE